MKGLSVLEHLVTLGCELVEKRCGNVEFLLSDLSAKKCGFYNYDSPPKS